MDSKCKFARPASRNGVIVHVCCWGPASRSSGAFAAVAEEIFATAAAAPFGKSTRWWNWRIR
eukprot:3775450-Lingulodinium_polyedra.AAC.1